VLGSPFGWAIPMEMKDAEATFNTFLRLLIDNKRRSAYVDEVIQEDLIENPDEISAFQRKIKVAPNTDPREVIQYLPYPDVSDGVLSILRFCEQWGNSASNLPAFLEGDNVQSSGTTAFEVNEQKSSALKMLGLTMQSIDENLLIPIVEDLYFWNMKYAEDETIKGDFAIQATGHKTFKDTMVKAHEIRQFLAETSGNEMLSQEVNYRGLLEELAKITGVGNENYLKTEEKKAEEQKQASEANVQALQQAKLDQQEQLQAMVQSEIAKIQAKGQVDLQKMQEKNKADFELANLKEQSENSRLDKKIEADSDNVILREEGQRLSLDAKGNNGN